MENHILDRPIWNALQTRQTEFALGGPLAKRFVPEVAAFADCADDSDAALAALTDLIPADGVIFNLSADARPQPPGTIVEKAAMAVQMIAEDFQPQPKADDIIALGLADVPEMMALAELTEPGPFFARTHEMGQFWGVRTDGRLAAMAGERMKPGPYSEVSGVCTHPDFRGKGHAARLSIWVASLMVERGEIPFLHSWADNVAATRLYDALGFRHRADIHVKVLRRG